MKNINLRLWAEFLSLMSLLTLLVLVFITPWWFVATLGMLPNLHFKVFNPRKKISLHDNDHD